MMAYAVDDVIEQLSDLPPFPEVTVKLLSMLGDESVTFEQLANVISADPSLVMKVIRMSNSPFYMTARPIESVKDAVLVLGIETLKNLTASISIHKGLSKLAPRSDIFDFMAYWKHSYATAIAASNIARTNKMDSVDRFYLAGLIHDTGKLVQAYYWPEAWKAAIKMLEATSDTYENIETRVFSSQHYIITTSLCRAWKFPANILTLIEELNQDSIIPANDNEKNFLPVANTIANIGGFRFPLQETPNDDNDNYKQYDVIMETLDSEVEHQLSILND